MQRQKKLKQFLMDLYSDKMKILKLSVKVKIVEGEPSYDILKNLKKVSQLSDFSGTLPSRRICMLH